MFLLKEMRKKKIILIIIIIFVLLIVGAALFIRFVPVEDIDFIRESDSPVAEAICSYPVTISSESMVPFFSADETVTFDKCFESDEIIVGAVVVYEGGGAQRLGIVREIQDEGRLVYKVSNEARPQDLANVLEDEVLGINDTDTSSSVYDYSDVEEINTELLEYMSEAYLGTIPRGAGLETADIQRASDFDLEVDKFCYIVNPIVDLANVDYVITAEGSDEALVEITDVMYSPGENINCDDNPLDLEGGDYVFVIFISDVLLEELPFTIL